MDWTNIYIENTVPGEVENDEEENETKPAIGERILEILKKETLRNIRVDGEGRWWGGLPNKISFNFVPTLTQKKIALC